MACEERTTTRTAIVAFPLFGGDYRRAHEAHHLAAGLWDQEVDWVHAEWKAKRNPGKYDIRAFLRPCRRTSARFTPTRPRPSGTTSTKRSGPLAPTGRTA